MTESHSKITRILVVDDDPNEMKSLVIGLRLEGFDSAGAASGPAALNLLGKTRFDAVLLDLMMPEMNGLQLAREIRARFSSIVTILMSAYHLSPIQLARADAGVVGFVPKPFSFEELVRFIGQKLDPKGGKDRPAVPRAKENGLHNPVDVPPPSGKRDLLQPEIDPSLLSGD